MIQEQIQIIKDCVYFTKNEEDLTKEFYKIMFNDYPKIKPIFNTEKAPKEQLKALTMMILWQQKVRKCEKLCR